MNLQAHTVSKTVAEVLAVTGLLDLGARDRVKLPSARTGAHRADGALLCRAHELIDLPRPRPDALAGGVASGAIRAVALMQGTPVDRHQHVRRDLSIARLRVRQRRVGARRDDRGEAGSVGSAAAHL